LASQQCFYTFFPLLFRGIEMARLPYSRIAERLYKAQSAMEYLMTYGWAILIIAVVLGALFQLGVFNPMTFAPKAPPGACQVFRPNGPYTTSFINLEGICSGEMPQYVTQFNGQNAYVTLPNIAGDVVGLSGLTVSVWVMPASAFTTRTEFVTDCSNEFFLAADGEGRQEGDWCVNTGGNWGCYAATTQALSPNTWWLLTGTYNNSVGHLYIYLDGQQQGNLGLSGTITNGGGSVTLGQPQCDSQYFSGNMADVQIYNTALSANEIQALYLEGIGGAPIDLQHLVGWWPLNGNANDYSGNGNNGVPSNVIFVSNWYNGYTPP